MMTNVAVVFDAAAAATTVIVVVFSDSMIGVAATTAVVAAVVVVLVYHATIIKTDIFIIGIIVLSTGVTFITYNTAISVAFLVFTTAVERVYNVILQHHDACCSPPYGSIVLPLEFYVRLLPIIQVRQGAGRAASRTVFEQRARAELEAGSHQLSLLFPFGGSPSNSVGVGTPPHG